MKKTSLIGDICDYEYVDHLCQTLTKVLHLKQAHTLTYACMSCIDDHRELIEVLSKVFHDGLCCPAEQERVAPGKLHGYA